MACVYRLLYWLIRDLLTSPRACWWPNIYTGFLAGCYPICVVDTYAYDFVMIGRAELTLIFLVGPCLISEPPTPDICTVCGI